MPKETRRQRRDARRAAGVSAGDGAAAVNLSGEAAQNAAADREYAKRGGFVRESAAELKKVEWPNRSQLIQGTIVVIIACVLVGAYLWGLDQILQPFVRDVLLGE